LNICAKFEFRFYLRHATHKRDICCRKVSVRPYVTTDIVAEIFHLMIDPISETNRRYEIPTGSPLTSP